MTSRTGLTPTGTEALYHDLVVDNTDSALMVGADCVMVADTISFSATCLRLFSGAHPPHESIISGQPTVADTLVLDIIHNSISLSTSFPQTSHPSVFWRAKSSIRERFPLLSTITSLKSFGFFECFLGFLKSK